MTLTYQKLESRLGQAVEIHPYIWAAAHCIRAVHKLDGTTTNIIDVAAKLVIYSLTASDLSEESDRLFKRAITTPDRLPPSTDLLFFDDEDGVLWPCKTEAIEINNRKTYLELNEAAHKALYTGRYLFVFLKAFTTQAICSLPVPYIECDQWDVAADVMRCTIDDFEWLHFTNPQQLDSLHLKQYAKSVVSQVLDLRNEKFWNWMSTRFPNISGKYQDAAGNRAAR